MRRYKLCISRIIRETKTSLTLSNLAEEANLFDNEYNLSEGIYMSLRSGAQIRLPAWSHQALYSKVTLPVLFEDKDRPGQTSKRLFAAFPADNYEPLPLEELVIS